jgi:hypothetical protein
MAWSRTSARARATTAPAAAIASISTGVFSSTTLGTSDAYRDFYTGISITYMVRPILTPHERERGRRLGADLRAARGRRSMVEVSAAAGIPVETLRKIETGRIVTQAFFTVAALARALDLDLAALAPELSATPDAATA